MLRYTLRWVRSAQDSIVYFCLQLHELHARAAVMRYVQLWARIMHYASALLGVHESLFESF